MLVHGDRAPDSRTTVCSVSTRTTNSPMASGRRSGRALGGSPTDVQSHRLDVVSGEDCHPAGDGLRRPEPLLCRGSSTSSARHAAYARAALMSSGSRYGYAARMSAAVFPAASSPTMVPAVIRNPRMHGRPPITWGSCVILKRASMGEGYHGTRGVAPSRKDRVVARTVPRGIPGVPGSARTGRLTGSSTARPPPPAPDRARSSRRAAARPCGASR